MAFLDNSGDIILDAVLTDTGRARLARADGSFRIAKFALGDDEIDYGLYDKAAASNQQDLEIMQTPVLEAFTNNSSLLKSRLLSVPRTNILHLPILKLNTNFSSTKMNTAQVSSPSFIVAADEDTTDAVNTTTPANGGIGTQIDGLMEGARPSKAEQDHVRIDQGLDTDELSPEASLASDLVDETYIVEIDNRFGNLVSVSSNSPANVSYIDDDNVASYYFSLGTDTEYVMENTETQDVSTQVISGPRGTFLQFKIRASLELNTSTYLFEQLGSSAVAWGSGGNTERHIDTNIRIMGATTGYTIDVPVRFIKKIT